MSDQRKRRGRPFKDDASRRSSHLNFRTTLQVRQRAEEEAAASGLSLSGYVEAALESHFTAKDLRNIVREEIGAALNAECIPSQRRMVALNDAAAGEPVRFEFVPQWRGHLPT